MPRAGGCDGGADRSSGAARGGAFAHGGALSAGAAPALWRAGMARDAPPAGSRRQKIRLPLLYELMSGIRMQGGHIDIPAPMGTTIALVSWFRSSLDHRYRLLANF